MIRSSDQDLRAGRRTRKSRGEQERESDDSMHSAVALLYCPGAGQPNVTFEMFCKRGNRKIYIPSINHMLRLRSHMKFNDLVRGWSFERESES